MKKMYFRKIPLKGQSEHVLDKEWAVSMYMGIYETGKYTITVASAVKSSEVLC